MMHDKKSINIYEKMSTKTINLIACVCVRKMHDEGMRFNEMVAKPKIITKNEMLFMFSWQMELLFSA